MVHSSFGRLAPQPARLGALTLVAIACVSAAIAGCGGSSRSSDSGQAAASPEPSSSAAPTTSGPPATNAQAGAGVDGAAIFRQRCALCHGPTGHGDGPGGKTLNPHPRNFHDAAYMNSRTDEQLSQVIHNGKGPMPRWGGILTDEQIKAVLAYVRQFSKTP